MRTVTINKVITKKMENWLKTITDLTLRNEVRDSIVVTGGCITSMLLSEDPNDYDVYLRDAKVCKRLTEYYISEMGHQDVPVYLTDKAGNFEINEDFDDKCDEVYVSPFIESNGYLSDKDIYSDEEVEAVLKEEELTPSEVVNTSDKVDKKYRPVFITSNAVTLSDQVQFITRFCGDPEVIHTNFDFHHTKMYWTKETGVVTNAQSLECVLAKRLIYTGSKFPLCSIIRTRKFIERGWTIDAGQYVKMAIQMNGFDLLEPRTLVQQLIGVDTTYFAWLLDEMTKPEHLTEEGKIDSNHAINLINYMFDSIKED